MTTVAEDQQVPEGICPRCRHPRVTLMARAPVGDAWEMYICGRCQYSWRSTEAPAQQDPEHFDRRFALTEADIENLSMVIPLPGERM